MINRKNMGDEEGCDLAKSLEYNYSLERLSLEGNLLGPKFLETIAKTLEVNINLRAIDLEGNCLTKGTEDGINALCKALRTNTYLNVLNLNNTQLTQQSGETIDKMLDFNKKLILIDVEKNPNIGYDTIRSIQDKMRRNREQYQQERKREWKERKELIAEEENITLIARARDEEVKTVQKIQREARETQLKREQIWVESLKQQEEDRKKMEKKIEKEALLRAKTKKRGKSKKKKP